MVVSTSRGSSGSWNVSRMEERMSESLRIDDALDGMGARMRAAAAGLDDAERSAGRLAETLERALGRSLEQAVLGGGKLADSLRGLAESLARSTLRSAIAPIGQAASSALTGAAQAGFGALLSGPVRAFSHGGVVDRATGFMAQGGLGLMGEAGPEAILPLARGADGRLGVRAGGGGGTVHVTVNVSTPDAESFRRSRGQVAAALARAVDQGRSRI